MACSGQIEMYFHYVAEARDCMREAVTAEKTSRKLELLHHATDLVNDAMRDAGYIEPLLSLHREVMEAFIKVVERDIMK